MIRFSQMLPFASEPTLFSPSSAGYATAVQNKLSLNEIQRRYKSLNSTQRKLANYVVRHWEGIPWKEALQRADAKTFFFLENQRLIYMHPNPQSPATVGAPLEYRFLFDHLQDSSTSTLVHALIQYRPLTLRAMAEFHGIKPAQELCVLQADLYTAIRTAAIQKNSLTYKEADLLSAVLEQDNNADLEEMLSLTDQPSGIHLASLPGIGLIENIGRWSKNPLATLLAKGFLVTDLVVPTSGGRWGMDEFINVPDELMAVLRAAALVISSTTPPPSEAEVSGKGNLVAAVPAPEKVLSREDAFWWDLWRILVASYSVPLEVTGGGYIAKRSIKKLAQTLALEEDLIENSAAYLMYHGVFSQTRHSRLYPEPKVVENPQEHFKKLADDHAAWVKYLFNRPKKGRSVYFFMNRFSHIVSLRASFAQQLAQRGAVWCSLDDLLQKILVTGEIAAMIKKEVYWGDSLHTKEARTELKRYLSWDRKMFYQFGLIEKSVDGEVVRASSVLSGRSTETHPLPLPAELFPASDKEPALVAQPNLEVVAPHGTPLHVHEVLGSFGSLVSVDRVAVYSFSLQSLHRGMEERADIKKLIEVLGATGQTFPGTFKHLLEDALGRVGEILITPASYVVRVQSPHLGKMLENLVKAKPLPGTNEYYLLAIGEYGLRDIMKQLKKKGYFPLLEVL